jgi:hypothetical protein
LARCTTRGIMRAPCRTRPAQFYAWGGSSAGRALRSQCRGRGFDPLPLHQIHFPQYPIAPLKPRSDAVFCCLQIVTHRLALRTFRLAGSGVSAGIARARGNFRTCRTLRAGARRDYSPSFARKAASTRFAVQLVARLQNRSKSEATLCRWKHEYPRFARRFLHLCEPARGPSESNCFGLKVLSHRARRHFVCDASTNFRYRPEGASRERPLWSTYFSWLAIRSG